MKIVSASEMREIDGLTSERFGVPSLTLMENAGAAASDFVLTRYPQAKTVGIVCGKGNNGGDGLVVARKLQQAGREVRLLLLAEPGELRGDAAEMFQRLPLKPVIASSSQHLNSREAGSVFAADLLIDAILGTGFRPPIGELYGAAIAALNASRAPVVALDIPSGADADGAEEQTGTIGRADAIVTFTAPRPAHVFLELSRGPVRIAPIGSPDDAVLSSLNLHLITAHDIAPLFQPRPRNANKGSFGHVLALGGSLGKAGSVAMAGIAALRSGAGLATVATPQSVLATVAGFHPELMTEPLPETEAGSIALKAKNQVAELAKNKTVLAIGPGISRHPETSQLVRDAVNNQVQPIVLDADGLNAFEGRAKELNGKGRWLVITPHPGEMARLLGSTIAEVQRDRIAAARNFSREHELIVVLKGHRTLIAKPSGEVWVNTTGNPGMATGGTGDILTGMVAGLMAQMPSRIFAAVTAAVYLHGLAGDVACETTGEQSLLATDLVEAIPEGFRRVRQAAQRDFVEIGGRP